MPNDKDPVVLLSYMELLFAVVVTAPEALILPAAVIEIGPVEVLPDAAKVKPSNSLI